MTTYNNMPLLTCFRVPYHGIFGGATGFTEDQFISVNGYSNQFFGWGGEDDDMFNRLVYTVYHLCGISTWDAYLSTHSYKFYSSSDYGD